jgi:hypothetical protein
MRSTNKHFALIARGKDHGVAFMNARAADD